MLIQKPCHIPDSTESSAEDAAFDGMLVLLADSLKGFNRSISCGLAPDTGRLRFFSSAFKSLTEKIKIKLKSKSVFKIKKKE